ncbi:hypothetical protein CLAFUW4_11953 [Fulvia fulva]|uniref:Extracellular membrane protein CFEM domain-containing protein n=1 Tax=Passalora fulva TaxID=5499 RepID=A0A1P8YXQ8_PASFU|nr:uncharacterized protein CLAFUR5_10995 [Fulvia fulva]AQA29302.1 hypothetical protein 9 [Fulvia fulva]KAK4618044.1 hypothetical protein CLAFUR4_11958 [Fulvia fulva]KAK4618417.1 hypothetical protein CLAFUR0_11969 [Fulvia fulva]UJO20641.1 hypothetical protein CLAFUR5_10995 [Fulvia fulva]WPV18099.1 hypothetical protein CLAFUW4_11953 [Fulvia fulva]
MRYTLLAMAAAITAVVADSDDCQATYKQCIADGYAEVKCSCDLTTCSGEDAARIRDYCATATANLPAPTKTSSATIITGTPGSQPSGQPPITAAEGSLPLGATCSDKKQCANGADCWGSNAGIIRRCGNFNGSCKEDSQCAYNTCNTDTGLCSGFLPTESYRANTVSSTGSAASSSATTYACNPAHQYPEGRQCVSTNGGLTLLPPTTTSASTATGTGYACNPAHQYPAGQVCTEIGGQLTLVTGGSPAATATATGVSPPVYGGSNSTTVRPTGTGAVNPSGSITPYQGSASVVETLSGLAALVAGVVAYVL